MTRAAPLLFSAAVLLSSCSTDSVNGPFDFAGACDVFDVTDITSDTDPDTVVRYEVLANCDMGSEIGETGAVIDFKVTSNATNNTLVITGESFYSTSQTDILVGEIAGTGIQVNPENFTFTATETYDGGTGDFDDIVGTGSITDGSITITAPGSGGWTVTGAID